MLNQKPTPEIRAFAEAVLFQAEHELIGGSTANYLPDYANTSLRKSAWACPMHYLELPAVEGRGAAVGVRFNGQQLIVYIGGERKAPILEARHLPENQPQYCLTSIKKAARIMLDKLPQVPRTAFEDGEAAHVYIQSESKKLSKHWQNIAAAAYYGTPEVKARLLRVFPLFFHRHIKSFHPARLRK